MTTISIGGTSQLPSSTLAATASLPSPTGCTRGQLPNTPGGSDHSICAIGTDSSDYSPSDALDAMRKCCGDSSTIYVLDGGCGLACAVDINDSLSVSNCLSEEVSGVSCSGGSEVIVSSGSGEGTVTDGGSGNSQTIISGATATVGDGGSSSGTPASTSADATDAAQSTGAASQVRMEVTSKGGMFAVGLLAVSFLSGALLL